MGCSIGGKPSVKNIEGIAQEGTENRSQIRVRRGRDIVRERPIGEKCKAVAPTQAAGLTQVVRQENMRKQISDLAWRCGTPDREGREWAREGMGRGTSAREGARRGGGEKARVFA